VNIQYSREAAEKQYREILAAHKHLAIYTDGSGINRKVGAAAVAPTLNMYTSAYLGRETTSTVYAAKLVGILMGLEIAMRANMRKIAVFTDNK
jgi:ribonuclease HI